MGSSPAAEERARRRDRGAWRGGNGRRVRAGARGVDNQRPVIDPGVDSLALVGAIDMLGSGFAPLQQFVLAVGPVSFLVAPMVAFLRPNPSPAITRVVNRI